jgi:epoxyqueuosine reductase
VNVSKAALNASQVKEKALALGSDLVGIADGAALETHRITEHDGGRVIVLAARIQAGTSRILPWNDRNKYYNDELTLTHLEEVSLELVYWLEDAGYPAIIVPPTHVDPWRYDGEPSKHREPLLSLPHAAVQAGLGTLGLAGQLLTPQYGPRVLLTAVLSSIGVEPDRPLAEALCRGPDCGRCLLACPGDVVQQWGRDWDACDRYRSPHGFAQLSEYLGAVIDEPDPEKKKTMLRSETSFDLWQSILRGAGVVTGCRRCADVCPVGADYDALLKDALEPIAEATPEKRARLSAMVAAESEGPVPAYVRQLHWIGRKTR